MPWRVDARQVLEAYTFQQLDWGELHIGENLGLLDQDDAGPLDAHVFTCDPVRKAGCRAEPNFETAVVTIERLVRRNRTGIWFVTGIDGPRRFEHSGVLASFPPVFVATTSTGEIRLINTASGAVIRTLASSDVTGGVGPNFNELALSPDRRFVYFAGHDGPAPLFRVPIEGGEADVIALVRGLSPPALSPDGRYLAYGARVSGDSPQYVAVRDLASDQEVRWESDDPELYIGQMGWLQDSRHLAVTFVHIGDTPSTVGVLDTGQKGAGLSDALTLQAQPSGAYWTAVGAYGGDSLVIYESCCGLRADEFRVMSVDPMTGQRRDVLVEPAGYPNALDAAGNNLIYVDHGTVMGWDSPHGPIVLAQGYVEADW